MDLGMIDDQHDHAHDRDHDHAADLRDVSRRRLVLALVMTGGLLGAEIVTGIVSGSLALFSEAGHMLTDAGALALALWAQSLGARPRSDRKTFGYRRAEILAAAANGIILGLTAAAVIVEAIRRLMAPPVVEGRPLLVVSVVGLVVNLGVAWNLARGGGQNMNVRAAITHTLADAAGSLAAIIAALLILAFGWTIADPITSLVISTLISVSAWRLLRDATHVLMQGTPVGISLATIERVARETPGVCDVHDLHVWSIVEDAPIVTLHVLLEPGAHGVEIARNVRWRIEKAIGRGHVTVQPETAPPEERLVPASSLVRP